MNETKRHPLTWVLSVYFAMGLPFVAIATTSTLMFKDLKISDAQIAFWTSIILLPWTLKPLWSPFLEMFKTKKYFVVGTQMLTGITFALVAFSLQLPDFFTYTVALLGVIAISGATHDIATDGIYLDELSPKVQSQFAGWQGAFYNFAKIISSGALVYLAGFLAKSVGVVHGWMIVMAIFATVLILLSVYHSRMLPSGASSTQVKSFDEGIRTLWDVVVTLFEKKNIVWYIAFVILYRFAEGFAIKIAPLFFKATREQGGLGLSTEQIGLIYGFAGAAAFIVGSILGGYYSAARGLSKTLRIHCMAFNIPFIVYALLAHYQPQSLFTIGTAVVFEYLGYGFGFVGLILFIMQQIAPGKYKMAHYAFAGGIMNLGFMIPSAISGYISDIVGYKEFFIWVLAATIPSFLITYLVPFGNPDAIETNSETHNPEFDER